MAGPIEFGIRLPDIFKAGFSGYAKNIIPLTLAGAVTLAVYAGFRYEAQQLLDDGRDFYALLVDLSGLVLASTMAYPWYFYALRASRGEKVDIRDPFYSANRFGHQVVASLFFWAGVLFGVRYGAGLFFLPAIAIAVLYAFHGYVIADAPPTHKGGSRGGSYALGTSVRLGEKRRFGIFGIGCLFALLNFVGIVPGLNIEEPPALRIGVLLVGLVITTSITLVGGGYLYDFLKEKLGD